jgi:hypothetical protein
MAASNFIKSFVLSFLLLSATYSASSQSQTFLGKFSALESGGKIYLNWLVLAGNSCNDVEIHRASDTLSFSRIGINAGVCGSFTESLSYDYTDESPLINATNYYRLDLGVYGYSDIVAVDVIGIDDSGFQLRPNPMQTEGLLYFNNVNQEKVELTIMTVNGNVVSLSSSQSDNFQIDSRFLPNGLYYFTLVSPSGLFLIRGKLMVQH